MPRRQRVLAGAVIALLALPGLLLSALTEDRLQIFGGFLFGVAVILAIGWAFYEVGLSEDRERDGGSN